MPPSFRNATEAAKVVQGAAQAAPTVAAALAPAPAPAPAAAPAPAPAVPQGQPKRQEPKDRGQGPRREERRAPPPPPPPPAQDERVRQIAARDIFDSSKAGPIEPKIGRGTPTPGPIAASPESLRARYAGSDMDAMVDATDAEKSLLTPADRAAALAQRQGMLDAMQRAAALRQSRASGRGLSSGDLLSISPFMYAVRGGYGGATTPPPPARRQVFGIGISPGTPMPDSALQNVAAFRDEVRKRGDAYRAMSQGLMGLETKAMELEAQSPRLPGVPVSPALASVDTVRREYQQKLAKLRADLAEAGLTDEQIDEQDR